MNPDLALWLACASLATAAAARATIIVDGTRTAGTETEYAPCLTGRWPSGPRAILLNPVAFPNI